MQSPPSPEGSSLQEHRAELPVPFHEGLEREVEAKFIETEDFGRSQWDEVCRTRHLNKCHPRLAWRRDRKEETFYRFILVSHHQIAGNLPLCCERARAGSTSAARQILAEPRPLPDADRAGN